MRLCLRRCRSLLLRCIFYVYDKTCDVSVAIVAIFCQPVSWESCDLTYGGTRRYGNKRQKILFCALGNLGLGILGISYGEL